MFAIISLTINDEQARFMLTFSSMDTWLFLAVIASGALHAGWNILAKKTGGNFAVLFLGQVVATLLCLPFALWYMDFSQLRGLAILFLALTGFIQALYFALLAKAYRFGDISSVYPIARGSGVGLTALVGLLFLQEHISVAGACGIAAIALGAMLLGFTQRPHEHARLSFVLALAIGLVLAAGSLNDKLAVGRLHPVTYIFFMFLCSVLLSAVPALQGKEQLRAAWRQAKLVSALIGVGSLLSYLIILFAIQLGPLGYVAAVREFAVVLGAVFGVVIFGEPLGRSKCGGLLAILLGLILIKIA